MKKFIVLVGMILLGIAIVGLISTEIQPAVGNLFSRSAAETRSINP